MVRWTSLFKSWILIWGVTFLVAGLILYTGYQSSLALSAQESAQKTTSQKAQAVSAQLQLPDTQDDVDRGVGLIRPARLERTIEDAPKSDLGQTDSDNKILSIKDFPSPVQGVILRSVGNYYSESFEDYLFHAGTDYAEMEGTMIRATKSGKVVSIGRDPKLGQKVTLDCGDGWMVTYGCLDNLRVQVGETVMTRGALGQVAFVPGADGANNQPQLHYEVWHNSEVQRPS